LHRRLVPLGHSAHVKVLQPNHVARFRHLLTPQIQRPDPPRAVYRPLKHPRQLVPALHLLPHKSEPPPLSLSRIPPSPSQTNPKVVFRSAKLIPVMLAGAVYLRRRYAVAEWVAAAAISASVALFTFDDSKASSADHRILGRIAAFENADGAGTALVALSLIFDCLIPVVQEKFFRDDGVKDMMWTNLFSTLLIAPVVLVNGEYSLIAVAVADEAKNFLPLLLVPPAPQPLLTGAALCGVRVRHVRLVHSLGWEAWRGHCHPHGVDPQGLRRLCVTV
jgi:hypothetical protein